MTCQRCGAGSILGFVLLPDVWRNVHGAELAVRHEIPLCADCLPHGDDQGPLRPDEGALAAEAQAWRRGDL